MPHLPLSSDRPWRGGPLDIRLANVASERFSFSLQYIEALIHDLNSETHRVFSYRDDEDQLQLIRLEAQRRLIAFRMDPGSRDSRLNESDISSGPTESHVSGIQQPGRVVPTTPFTRRTRSAIQSDSEISVLDIGPGVSSSSETLRDVTTAMVRRTSAAFRSGIMVSATAESTIGPNGASSNGSNTPPLHNHAAPESVAVTSTSGSVNGGVPLSQRTRRVTEVHNIARSGPSVQYARDTRALSTGAVENVRSEYPFPHLSISQLYSSDESIRRIYSLSVPHTPLSPPAQIRSHLTHPPSSLGREPEFASVHTAGQVNGVQSSATVPAVYMNGDGDAGNAEQVIAADMDGDGDTGNAEQVITADHVQAALEVYMNVRRRAGRRVGRDAGRDEDS